MTSRNTQFYTWIVVIILSLVADLLLLELFTGKRLHYVPRADAVFEAGPNAPRVTHEQVRARARRETGRWIFV